MKYAISLAAAAFLVLGLAAETQAQTQRDYDTVRSWYLRYLGREPDPTGYQGYARQLTFRPANDILAEILGSPEYLQRHGGTLDGFVIGLYNEVLQRQPRPDEVNVWLDRLSQVGGDRNQAALDFLVAAGPELANRFNLGVPPPPPPEVRYDVPRSLPLNLGIRFWRR